MIYDGLVIFYVAYLYHHLSGEISQSDKSSAYKKKHCYTYSSFCIADFHLINTKWPKSQTGTDAPYKMYILRYIVYCKIFYIWQSSVYVLRDKLSQSQMVKQGELIQSIRKDQNYPTKQKSSQCIHSSPHALLGTHIALNSLQGSLAPQSGQIISTLLVFRSFFVCRCMPIQYTSLHA